MSLLSSTLAGTSYLILLQAISRLLTFSLNQLILRFTTPSIFGFATIQLELLLSSILFLCREGFRISVQRMPVQKDQEKGLQIVNLSYIPVVAGVFISSFFSWLYISQASTETCKIPHFSSTVYLYALSTILELLSEPCYNVALHRLLYKVRATCEGTAIVARCLVTFTCSLYGSSNFGALPFAFGQLAYSAVLPFMYYVHMRGEMEHFLPRRLASGSWFHSSQLSLSLTNTAQGILKHLLTEGDKILISLFNTNEEQGTYGLAANYGGLVARIIFQPVEEASRSYFANLLPPSPSWPNSKSGKKSMPKEDKPAATTHTVNRTKAVNALALILRIYLLFSLLLVSFLPSLIQHILPQILSSQWSRVTPVLAAYCYYIPLLAVNGILEAFVSATATPRALRFQALCWIPCSLAFAAAGLVLRGYGAQGLVYANCVNLSLRIAWAATYIVRWFGWDLIWKQRIFPSLTVSVGLLVMAYSRQRISRDSDDILKILATTAACGLGGLGIVCMSELQLLSNLIHG